jgi:hypothetical protein
MHRMGRSGDLKPKKISNGKRLGTSRRYESSIEAFGKRIWNICIIHKRMLLCCCTFSKRCLGCTRAMQSQDLENRLSIIHLSYINHFLSTRASNVLWQFLCHEAFDRGFDGIHLIT